MTSRSKPTGRRKPDEDRQRRGSVVDLVPLAGGKVDLPDPPKKWLAVTVEAYERYRGSTASSYLDPEEAETHVALRYFGLLDQAERLEREGRRNSLIKGSAKQLSLNPLLKHAQAMRDEARKDEAVLGIGPSRRMALGIKRETGLSLEAMNRRLDASDDEDEGEDPRLGVVEVRSR